MKQYENNLGPLNKERAKFLDLLNFNKTISKAEGSYLYTDEGEKLLDFTSQYGAVPFGHNPEFLWRELLEQQEALPGIMIQPFQSKGAEELAAELVAIAPGNPKHVTLACSGAEAIETAIKMARAKTGRIGILSTLNSFHGKTMAASLATGNAYYRESFQCSSDDFSYIPYDNLAALEASLQTQRFAAFLVEPIQGEGGMIEPSPGYLKACEVLCSRFGTLLVVDEIQVGLGRTGTLFACEQEDVHPDIIVIAKALGGGMLPISACIASDKAWSKDFGQRHSSTFANNHLTARIGLSVIQKLKKETAILENINTVGAYLKQSLSELVNEFPKVFLSASGRGLMQGLVVADWQDEDSYLAGAACGQGYSVPLIAGYLLNRHQLFTAPTLNASHVLRIQPNYLTTKQHIDQLLVGLRDVGQLICGGRFSELFRSAIGLKSEKNRNPIRKQRVCKNNIAKTSGPKLGTFAFLMHPTTPADVIASMPGGVAAYDREESARIAHWIDKLKAVNSLATPAFHIPVIPSKQGGYVDGWLITCPLNPRELMRLPKQEKALLMDSYIAAAKSKNATMIGLGAFTSVISRSGSLVADCGVPVTTGNAYTALTSTDSIRKICKKNALKLGDLHLGVVGVSGSVGRLAMLDLGPDCRKVSLIGNARNKTNYDSLESVAGELLVEIFCGNRANRLKPIYLELLSNGVTEEQVCGDSESTNDAEKYRRIYHRVKYRYELSKGAAAEFPIMLSNDINSQLAKCHIVVTATSNGEAFIQSEMLLENAIVCDVARPSDLTAEVKNFRKDVIVFEGGLVNLPAQMRFGGANIVGLDTGVSLACLSETIILTMAQAKQNYSIGGVSSIEEARRVFNWGLQHGFSTFLPTLELPEVEREVLYA